MRFSITSASFIVASLVLGSNAGFAFDPAYIPTWGVQADSHGVLGRGAPALKINNGEIYMTYTGTSDPELRFQLVGATDVTPKAITAAKLVEYPGYDTDDQGFYMSQPVGGTLVYSPLDEATVGLGSWWLQGGPSNDPQYRLTLDGSATAAVLWDSSKNWYKVYIGSNIPTGVVGMVAVELKVTKYCGPGNTYCF